MRPRRAAAPAIAALAAMLLLTACSLAGDVTPPSGAAGPPAAATPIFPASAPSIANGAQVYAAHCAQCHGPAGRGDGELVAQLQFPPADFTDPALARNATPAGWFAVVTQGNLERMMPPFADALSEAERWDAVAYLFTLGAAPEAAASGQEIYEANCAACHGAAGRGDGPQAQAGRPPPDFGDQERMAGLSQADLFGVISSGAGADMPAFADALTEEERWAAAGTVRAFAFDTTVVAEAEGVIAGQVTNGTLGEPAPGGLAVTLHGFDNFQLAATLTETVQADGSFLFAAVPYRPDRAFLLTTEYAGVSYGSDVLTFEPGTERLEAPLTVYEATSDTAALQIDRLHIFFDFSPGNATVGELLLISNSGGETVRGEPGLQFGLPDGALDLRIDGLTAGQDYVETPGGFTLTQPITPGQNSAQLLVSFSLPYERSLDFAQTLPLPVGAANVLIPEGGVTLAGAQWQNNGQQALQDIRFTAYSAPGLPAGGALTFRLSGRGAAGTPLVAVDAASLAVGALTLALMLGGVGWWYYSRGPAVPPDEREALVREVAALDDDFEAGRVPQVEYRKRRAALKARLVEVWRR